MPPKNRKSKKRKTGGKKHVEIDWTLDPNFDENRAIIYIEHTDECPIFLEKAKEFEEFLSNAFPKKIFQSILNGNGKVPAREGAFEISFSQNARTERLELWTGIEKGPPRRDKFPATFDVLLPEIERILKKIYVDVSKQEKNDLDMDEFEDEPVANTQIIRKVTYSETTT